MLKHLNFITHNWPLQLAAKQPAISFWLDTGISVCYKDLHRCSARLTSSLLCPLGRYTRVATHFQRFYMTLYDIYMTLLLVVCSSDRDVYERNSSWKTRQQARPAQSCAHLTTVFTSVTGRQAITVMKEVIMQPSGSQLCSSVSAGHKDSIQGSTGGELSPSSDQRAGPQGEPNQASKGGGCAVVTFWSWCEVWSHVW